MMLFFQQSVQKLFGAYSIHFTILSIIFMFGSVLLPYIHSKAVSFGETTSFTSSAGWIQGLNDSEYEPSLNHIVVRLQNLKKSQDVYYFAVLEFVENVYPKVYISWLLLNIRQNLGLITLAIVVLRALYFAIDHVTTSHRLRKFSEKWGCVPARIMPNPFPWKLRRYFELSKVDANLLDEYLLQKYEKNGLTHGLATVITGRVKAVSTIEPENFKSVLATSFDDWERPKFRAGAARPFLGPGILTMDLEPWAHSRRMMKSQFTRKRMDDNLIATERHLQEMYLAMGKTDYRGWTEVADYMDYFFRFAMDSSTEFLFGLSANTQYLAHVRAKPHMTHQTQQSEIPEVSMEGFEDAFKRVQKHVGVRMKVGKSYWMIDGPSYRLACRDLIAIKNPYIEACMERAKSQLKKNNNEPTNVMEAMVVEGHDFDYIANQCRHLIIAGFETTSALLGFSFALLERHSDVFEKLRGIVLETFGTIYEPKEELNFETLKGCKYLQYILNETLRLYPAGPSIQRVAVRDTVLPRGGGADGMSPMAVPKGSTVQLGIYLSHRRKDIWGEDAIEFKPERWENKKKSYDFIPFIAGPQICLGQQYSVTQVAYVIVRFLMRFDEFEKPIGFDNLRKGWQTVLTPGNGVQLRLHEAKPT